MKKTTILLILALALAAPLFGQVTMIPTTLSAAITDSGSTTVVVAAATGLNSNSYSIAAKTSYLYVDGEYMAVNKVNGTTLSVTRGYGGTRAGTHASGALVFVGPSTFFGNSRLDSLPVGSCTRSNVANLPRPEILAQRFVDCLGGNWVVGQNSQQQVPYQLTFPNIGGTVYTGLNTNGTTPSANTQYCSEVDLPYNFFATGLGPLAGTTVASGDKWAVALYDASGNLLYQSAKAGAVTATSTTFQKRAFTLNGNGNTIAKAYLVGPARYFACMQTDSGSDTIRMAVTGQADTVLTKSVSSITLGTFGALTVPTSFTTAVGPYFVLY